jgi:hypothetical protein
MRALDDERRRFCCASINRSRRQFGARVRTVFVRLPKIGGRHIAPGVRRALRVGQTFVKQRDRSAGSTQQEFRFTGNSEDVRLAPRGELLADSGVRRERVTVQIAD